MQDDNAQRQSKQPGDNGVLLFVAVFVVGFGTLGQWFWSLGASQVAMANDCYQARGAGDQARGAARPGAHSDADGGWQQSVCIRVAS